ncbi:MAG: hypothetical protein JKY65_00650 [Planctomycetes bacterium]|nr:hypothetical protein [Planctomycetota bacterium]
MTLLQIQIGFFAALTTSVALLVGAAVTAKLHKVKAHMTVVAVMVVALLVTIYFAESMGPHYVFEPFSRQVHLPLAFLATGSLAAPLITGFLHWRGRASVKTHKLAVGGWVVTVLLALGTGIWMLAAATPLASVEGGHPGPTPPAQPAASPVASPAPSARTN